MAQTKRKRRSKHRGTAAGTVQARGRTSRPPSATERKKQDRAKLREERLNKPPTWRSSLNRAAIGAALMFLFLLFVGPKKDRLPTAILFTVFALLLYAPAGYYIERSLWRRRQRKKGAG
jgi:Flp pilus assembly protein TadB